MAFIYKIINDINDKIYVGKTENHIEKRFKEHCNDAFRMNEEKRPLYAAMRKYGIDKFHIELIEETDKPEEREIYWIGFFDGYTKGYNATLGGDGKRLFDYDAIIAKLLEYPYPKEVAAQFGCSVDTVYNIAKTHNIVVKNRGSELLKKSIQCYDKMTNELIDSFDSTAAAAEWCFMSGKCATLNSGVRGHIAEAANGKRKSAYGCIWRYC